MPNYGRSVYLCDVISPKSWETKLNVTQISVYCRHVFNNVNVCIYLQKLLHCLRVYTYRTNKSFSPCPYNIAIKCNRTCRFKTMNIWVKTCVHVNTEVETCFCKINTIMISYHSLSKWYWYMHMFSKFKWPCVIKLFHFLCYLWKLS